MLFKVYFLIFLSYLLSLHLIVVSGNDTIDKLFKKFKKDFRKVYKTATEEEHRLSIFAKNIALINKHKQEQRSSTYRLGITEYTDLEIEEFHGQVFGSYKKGEVRKNKFSFKPPKDTLIPESIDWREKGAVTPVKSQDKCGSCWAFAATAALESHNFLKTGKLTSLSEQNLIDCTLSTFGCNGGMKERAFQYVIDNKGIATEMSYPYQALKNPFCLFNLTLAVRDQDYIGATSKDYIMLPPKEEKIMTIAVGTVGPIAVALNKKCLYMQFYKEGVFNQDDCDPYRKDHALLIVGYGRDNKTLQDYWILKNSWGTSWGMNGYMKVPRFENYGGISEKPSYPVV